MDTSAGMSATSARGKFQRNESCERNATVRLDQSDVTGKFNGKHGTKELEHVHVGYRDKKTQLCERHRLEMDETMLK